MFSGLNPAYKTEIGLFENKYGYTRMLIENSTTLYSICEHHFVPINGKIHVAYIPDKQVIGLSKINRLVQYYAKSPQVLERLTVQISEALREILQLNDVAVVVEADHLCIASRRIKYTNSITLTAQYSGQIENETIRQEFLSHIYNKGEFIMEPVKIIAIEHLTHDVLKVVAEKPASISYHPGQAVDISINQQNWESELRAFTFTSLPGDNYIEFTIKTYPSHNGVTAQLLLLNKGDELLIHDVFGDITYKGEGVFIAGGAGITPFIAILKQLEKENKIGNNKLIFANKTKADIILEDKFRQLLGGNFINVLSDEKITNYIHGFISADLIKKHTTEQSKYFYLCGPELMMQAVEKHLSSLGIAENLIIKEAF